MSPLRVEPFPGPGTPSSSSLLLSSLELSDTTIYEPYMRALLGTASHFCEVVVLKLRTAPGHTWHRLLLAVLARASPCLPRFIAEQTWHLLLAVLAGRGDARVRVHCICPIRGSAFSCRAVLQGCGWRPDSQIQERVRVHSFYPIRGSAFRCREISRSGWRLC